MITQHFTDKALKAVVTVGHYITATPSLFF